MQAPPTRDPLQPAGESALNSRSSTPPHSRKRKRDEGDDTNSFTAKAVEAKTHPSSVTFAPVVLVPRSNIPLVWLAPVASYKTLASPYLFETCLSPAWQHEGCALVARLAPNGGLYAVEKASQKTWVACRLSSWVTEEHCRDAAHGHVRLLDHDTTVGRKTHARSESQSTTASGRPITSYSPKRPNNRRGALARMSILSSRDSHNQTNTPEQETPSIVEPAQIDAPRFREASDQMQNHNPALEPLPSVEEHIGNEVDTPRSGPTVLSVEVPVSEQPRPFSSPEHVVQQYLDTLYLKRTSLAFYAKGPLSRARAKAKSGGGDLDIEGLAEVYRSCIMPTKKRDLKYKESLPGAVKALNAIDIPVEGQKVKKKRALKKLKLGRDGLYNCEIDTIEKWWHGREITSISAVSANAAETELNRAVSDLRTRETQMQLLLILEVMALESITSSGTTPSSSTVGASIKTEIIDEDVSKVLAHTPKVKKKPRDFQFELDALVDKLCIWHTVSLDNMSSSPDKNHDGDEASTRSKDRLKEFWAEVIKPFYGAKLPEQTKSLCRKLGAADVSPQRHRPSSSKLNSDIKSARSTKSKPRSAGIRTLERVLSEDKSVRHASPPILPRSSTVPNMKRDPSILNLKREPSDVSVRPASRSDMQKSVSFMVREIDLVAEAKAHGVKKRKLDKINAQQNELKAAIEALKKPNRGNAARAIMDEVEHHQAIQITATPGRRKAAHLLKSGHKLLGVDEDTVSAAEVNHIIPSSTMKHLPMLSTARSSSKKRAVLAAISDTPSRGVSRLSNMLQLPALSGSAGNTILSTPATSRLRSDLSLDQLETPVPKMRNSGRTVLFTPLGRTDVKVQDVFKDAPMIPEGAGKAMDRVMGGRGIGEDIGLDASMNIYDQLGWDNDDQDL